MLFYRFNNSFTSTYLLHGAHACIFLLFPRSSPPSSSATIYFVKTLLLCGDAVGDADVCMCERVRRSAPQPLRKADGDACCVHWARGMVLGTGARLVLSRVNRARVTLVAGPLQSGHKLAEV